MTLKVELDRADNLGMLINLTDQRLADDARLAELGRLYDLAARHVDDDLDDDQDIAA